MWRELWHDTALKRRLEVEGDVSLGTAGTLPSSGTGDEGFKLAVVSTALTQAGIRVDATTAGSGEAFDGLGSGKVSGDWCAGGLYRQGASCDVFVPPVATWRFEETKAEGQHGGASTGGWDTRALAAAPAAPTWPPQVDGPQPAPGVGAGTFVLPAAGVYAVEAAAASCGAGPHRLRLFDTAEGAELLTPGPVAGASAVRDLRGGVTSWAQLVGLVEVLPAAAPTLAAGQCREGSELRLEHRTLRAQAAIGLGRASGLEGEMYAHLEIRRLA